MILIAIAGGSGSGKSSISYRLVDSNPKIFEVLNLDDYQKVKGGKSLPKYKGMINWDHPDIIRWEKLSKDVKTLQKGKSVTIQTWSHRSNPDYFTHKKLIPRTIFPKKIIVIEGYLALWNKSLKALFKRAYYLDLSFDISRKRRNKFEDSEYDLKVLKPMQKKYVEPTKKYADKIFDISNMSEDQVFREIKRDLKMNKLI